MSKFTFSEEQRFSKKLVLPLVILITAFTVGLMCWGNIQQLILGKPFGNHPVSDTSLLISSIFIFIFIILMDWLLLKVKLVTEINSDTIRYRFYPFILRDRYLYWQDIEKSYIRQYKPLKEYGGWGIRFGHNGKALNIKGNNGLQLELKNGKKLLIGTQKPEELEELLITLGKSRK